MGNDVYLQKKKKKTPNKQKPNCNFLTLLEKKNMGKSWGREGVGTNSSEHLAIFIYGMKVLATPKFTLYYNCVH